MTTASPDNQLAQAREALRRGDGAAALTLLDAIEPSQAVHLDRALALRLLQRLPEAIEALDEALALDPYSLLALLSKAAELCEDGTSGVEVWRDSKRIDEIDCDPKA